MDNKIINTDEVKQASQEVEKSTNNKIEFTQEQQVQINSIVQKRVREEKETYKKELANQQTEQSELETLKEKAKQFDNMQLEVQEATLQAKIIKLGVNPEHVVKAMKLIDLTGDIESQINNEVLTIPGFGNTTPKAHNVSLGNRGSNKQTVSEKSEKIKRPHFIGYPS